MLEAMSFLGLSWTKGHPETAILSFGTKEDDLVGITKRQFWALLQVFEAVVEASPETIAATPLLSWLAGYEVGSQTPKTHSCSNLDQATCSSCHPAVAETESLSTKLGKGCWRQIGPEYPTTLDETHNSPLCCECKSGDSVAADPRNDATPATSAKGVRDDG